MAGSRAWNPWRELRARPHLIFRQHDVAKVGGGGLYLARGDRAAIVIDPDLGPVERRVVLAHELVHDERGGCVEHPDAAPALGVCVHREENRVARIVAERLVPADELEAFVDRIVGDGGAVTPGLAAEHFEVTEAIAIEALVDLQLTRRRRSRELRRDGHTE